MKQRWRWWTDNNMAVTWTWRRSKISQFVVAATSVYRRSFLALPGRNLISNALSRPVPAPVPASRQWDTPRERERERDIFSPEQAIYGKIARRGVKNFERRATSGWVQQVIAGDVWLCNARGPRRLLARVPSSLLDLALLSRDAGFSDSSTHGFLFTSRTRQKLGTTTRL